MVPVSEISTAAVILAGGFGTRIKHLLREVPKPMAPVAGRPFVEYVVRHLAAAGIGDVVLSTGHLADVVAAHFVPEVVPGVKCTCVREDGPLGTAGGFLHAAEGSGLHPTVWLVTNGDSLAYAPLRPMLHEFSVSDYDAAVLGLRVDDASRYGTLETGPDGTLLKFSEKRPGAGLINAGVYLFRAGLLTAFPARRPLSFENEIFPALLAAGRRIGVHPITAPFLDIGTPESLEQAEQFILQNTLRSPAR